MAFDNLSSRLQMGLRRITGKGKLNENDIDDMLREVRLSLLEADVNYKVVKKFLANIKEQALGENILKGLNPGQQVVKIVREELKKTLGDEAVELTMATSGMTVVMAVGLQGAGKTTAVGKMALFYRKKLKKKPMLIAADIYRPAAVDQLVTLGKQIDVPVFEMGTKVSAQKIVTEGLKKAKEEGFMQVANSFFMIAEIEKMHGDRFGRFAELLENKGLFMENGITKWICLNCGYVWEGDGVPEKCPVCYHGKGYFIRLDESPFER